MGLRAGPMKQRMRARWAAARGRHSASGTLWRPRRPPSLEESDKSNGPIRRGADRGAGHAPETPHGVLALAVEGAARIADLRFCDLPRLIQHFSIAVEELTEDGIDLICGQWQCRSRFAADRSHLDHPECSGPVPSGSPQRRDSAAPRSSPGLKPYLLERRIAFPRSSDCLTWWTPRALADGCVRRSDRYTCPGGTA